MTRYRRYGYRRGRGVRPEHRADDPSEGDYQPVYNGAAAKADDNAGTQEIVQILLVLVAVAAADQRLHSLRHTHEYRIGKRYDVPDYRIRVHSVVADVLYQCEVHAEDRHRRCELGEHLRQAACEYLADKGCIELHRRYS